MPDTAFPAENEGTLFMIVGVPTEFGFVAPDEAGDLLNVEDIEAEADSEAADPTDLSMM